MVQCAEMVRKFAVSVAEVSVYETTDKCSSSKQNSSSTSTLSSNSSQANLSESQLRVLQFASCDIQAAIDKFIDSVRKDCMSNVTTPRGKRLLPSQPKKKTS